MLAVNENGVLKGYRISKRSQTRWYVTSPFSPSAFPSLLFLLLFLLLSLLLSLNHHDSLIYFCLFLLLDPQEKARIEAAGGHVIGDRVMGPTSAINMSRAMGDFTFKMPLNRVRLLPFSFFFFPLLSFIPFFISFFVL